MPRTGLSAEELKDKAVELAIEKMRIAGFEKVRLTDIARGIGVSHAALYAHFADKAALLDAVSERWLLKIEAALESILLGKEPPLKRIQMWFLKLHRMKLEKVLHDPELYRAFNMAAEQVKPFVRSHLETTRRHLTTLAAEAMEAKKLRKADPAKVARILNESMTAFTHPKLVAQHLGENREDLLRQLLEIVLKGLA